MKALQILSAYSLCILLLSACSGDPVQGNGILKEENRHLGPAAFSRIEIDAPVNTRITVGSPAALTLKGDANLLRYVRSDIRNNTLHIYTDEHVDLNLRKNMSAIITLPALTDFDASGAGSHDISGTIQSEEFNLELSGASSLTISEMQVRSFGAALSGATSLNLRSGTVGHGKYEVSGTGDIRAFGVTHQVARIDLSGAADAELTVTGTLEVEISGTGTVKYKGHPAVTQDVSGIGSVTDAN